MPEEFMGDVIGDLNSRRGQIDGMESRGGTQVVRAFMPLALMFGYVTDLRSACPRVGRARRWSSATTRRCPPRSPPSSSRSRSTVTTDPRDGRGAREKPRWRRRSSSAPSRTSTSARSATSTMARRRLTAAITKYLALKGGAEYRAFDTIDNAPEERERGHHHRHRPRRVRDRRPPLRPRRLPGPRRLHQEHDHRRGPDGRRHPRRRRDRRPDAPDPGAHPAGPPGGGARTSSSSSTRSTWSTTRSCSTSSSSRSASC